MNELCARGRACTSGSSPAAPLRGSFGFTRCARVWTTSRIGLMLHLLSVQHRVARSETSEYEQHTKSIQARSILFDRLRVRVERGPAGVLFCTCCRSLKVASDALLETLLWHASETAFAPRSARPKLRNCHDIKVFHRGLHHGTRIRRGCSAHGRSWCLGSNAWSKQTAP